ncbi:hypothetical protein B0J12DRAFT_681197 [Macrophomina phaseolina]|uniref:Uncharacterized protein n=1 Tax=Macrophomina phaseolina TaxID=35725 RepID=A0ABQ8FZJ8_9PEZI|nr:hypothetical protein B0J12DRAFT_681197 [Macrophomina phaseolina]
MMRLVSGRVRREIRASPCHFHEPHPESSATRRAIQTWTRCPAAASPRKPSTTSPPGVASPQFFPSRSLTYTLSLPLSYELPSSMLQLWRGEDPHNSTRCQCLLRRLPPLLHAAASVGAPQTGSAPAARVRGRRMALVAAGRHRHAHVTLSSLDTASLSAGGIKTRGMYPEERHPRCSCTGTVSYSCYVTRPRRCGRERRSGLQTLHQRHEQALGCQWLQ